MYVSFNVLGKSRYWLILETNWIMKWYNDEEEDKEEEREKEEERK